MSIRQPFKQLTKIRICLGLFWWLLTFSTLISFQRANGRSYNRIKVGARWTSLYVFCVVKDLVDVFTSNITSTCTLDRNHTLVTCVIGDLPRNHTWGHIKWQISRISAEVILNNISRCSQSWLFLLKFKSKRISAVFIWDNIYTTKCILITKL